ncbi:hypothetical protein LPJ78_001268 [Coemansia sp. RSA 989]|nr:hypothetical protein LPJ68_000659 [Coemansia sp. RSA 1086]KAJ1752610.1 hypothetical protein LPJ79_001130 [Coemansia sp. RSA 1821]KAJ1867177.1 hypothetical protein LPJ78_001268 [Coemansia sp. RSA 989]
MVNAPVPRTVPTQRAGSQQEASPMVTSAAAAAVNIQAIQQMFSPQPGPGSQQAPHSMLASPMTTSASLSDIRSAPGIPTQHNPMAQSAAPQLPTTMRQQTMPVSIGASMGINPSELGLQGGNAAMAAMQSGLAGRVPHQAMMAYVQQQQQQLQQQAAAQVGGMAQGPPGQIPRNHTTIGAASETPGMRIQGMANADGLANINAGQPQMPASGAFPLSLQHGMMTDPRQQYMLQMHLQSQLHGSHPSVGISQAALQQHHPAAGSATPPVLQRRPGSVAADQQAQAPKKLAKTKTKRGPKRTSKTNSTDNAALSAATTAAAAGVLKTENVQSPPTVLSGLNGNDPVIGGYSEELAAMLNKSSSSSGNGSGEMSTSMPNIGVNIGVSNEWSGNSNHPLFMLNMENTDELSTVDPVLSSLMAASNSTTNMSLSAVSAAPSVDSFFSPATASNPNM